MPSFQDILQTAVTNVIFDAKLDDSRLVSRRIFDTDTYYYNKPVPGHKITVPVVKNSGSATVVPHGESKAIAESDPIIDNIDHNIVSIKSKIRITKDEVIECQNMLNQGFGLYNATELKILNAKRQISTEEEKLVLLGNNEADDVKGLIYSPYSYQESVSSWIGTKTKNTDILKQVTNAIMYMQDQGVHMDQMVLLVSAPAYAKLMNPYSDMNSMSLLSWIKNESGLNIDENRVYIANVMRKDYVSRFAPKGSTPLTDGAFVLCSRDPQDITLGTVQDIMVNEFMPDGLGGYVGSCDLNTAGALIKFEGSCYVGIGNES